MSEKRFNTRVINKHDIEANWKLAVNFTPLPGELIVYDPDTNYNYSRFKIGDGETLVNDLPFCLDESKLSEVVENALAQAKASGEFDGEDGKSGVYIGSTEPTDPSVDVWIDDDGIEDDVSITAENIKNALGYTPADAKDFVAIPDYVMAEAEAVIDRVLAAQGGRTFTLASITDMHYGSSDYIDGVIHACQGLERISKRIKFDALAVLGDYTDEHQMDTETAVTDLEEMNALLDPLRVNVNLRMKGNHDHRPNAAAQTYRYIMAYSDGVVWGSRIGGYFYRDFSEYKIRIICLNTTEVSRDNLSVSDAQYRWFVDALDLSALDDAAEWGILILSHHPVDFTVTSGKYRFGPIINAYQNGESWTDGTITCDYTDKNLAAIVGNVHGHLHNLLTEKIYVGEPGNSDQTNVWRMCTPAARVDYANHYGSPWRESTTYAKTQNTAEDTAFCVYCVDLDAHTIQAFCYGAGYDRSIEYDVTSAGPKYTNLLPQSVGDDGAVYNGVGWKKGVRYSTSSKAESTAENGYLSGWMAAKNGDVVRLENVGLNRNGTSNINNVVFYGDSGNVYNVTAANLIDEGTHGAVANDDGNIIRFVVGMASGRFRINASYIGEDSIITVNEEITD